jgi:hypothetical protein
MRSLLSWPSTVPAITKMPMSWIARHVGVKNKISTVTVWLALMPMSKTVVILARGQVVVAGPHLAALESRARGNDCYLAAIRSMAPRREEMQSDGSDYGHGWADAMRELGEAILAADRAAG